MRSIFRHLVCVLIGVLLQSPVVRPCSWRTCDSVFDYQRYISIALPETRGYGVILIYAHRRLWTFVDGCGPRVELRRRIFGPHLISINVFHGNKVSSIPPTVNLEHLACSRPSGWPQWFCVSEPDIDAPRPDWQLWEFGMLSYIYMKLFSLFPCIPLEQSQTCS